MIRIACLTLLAATISASSLFAAEVNAPLTPGKPAGITKAQLEGSAIYWVLGVGAVVAIVAAEGSTNKNSVNLGNVTVSTST